MTTVFISDKNCFICGASSKYPMGNGAMGNIALRDLDGRPTHILRSSVYLWIQRCPSCGYCAPEIAQGEHHDAAILEREEYKLQLVSQEFPETANSFLCHAIVMRASAQFADAAWASVFAAWVCDDNDFPESAVKCRLYAIDYFLQTRAQGETFADSVAQENIYLIDLYRRCRNFTEAQQLCDAELDKNHPDEIIDMLYLEKSLIEKQDAGVHSTSEIDELI